MAADPHVISALSDKTHELRQAIVTYEELLERTRHELAVITATLTIMGRDGHHVTGGRPAHVRNLFKRGEPLALCKAALAEAPGGMTTRELAVACLGAREFDDDDLVLVRAMVGVLSNTLKKAARRGEGDVGALVPAFERGEGARRDVVAGGDREGDGVRDVSYSCGASRPSRRAAILAFVRDRRYHPCLIRLAPCGGHGTMRRDCREKASAYFGAGEPERMRK